VTNIVNLNLNSLLIAKKAQKAEQRNFKMNKLNFREKEATQKKKTKLKQVKLELKPNYSQAIIDILALSREFKRNQLWNKFTSVSIFSI
jgi:hypothetical protein